MHHALRQHPAATRGWRSGRTTVVGAMLAIALAAWAVAAAVAPGRAVSATPPCTQYVSTSAVGSALGLPVRSETSEAVQLNGSSLGVMCGFYPIHPTQQFPSSEPAGTLVVAEGTGTAAAGHRLIAYDTNPKTDPGFKRTSLHGIGTQATLGVEKGNRLVIVCVLSGHTVYYVWSQEAHKKAVEKFAGAVAGGFIARAGVRRCASSRIAARPFCRSVVGDRQVSRRTTSTAAIASVAAA